MELIINKITIKDTKSPKSLAEITTTSIVENFGYHEENLNKIPTLLQNEIFQRKMILDDANFESWILFHNQVNDNTSPIEATVRSKGIELLEVLSRRADVTSCICERLASNDVLNEASLEAYLSAFETITSLPKFGSIDVHTRCQVIKKILGGFRVHLCFHLPNCSQRINDYKQQHY